MEAADHEFVITAPALKGLAPLPGIRKPIPAWQPHAAEAGPRFRELRSAPVLPAATRKNSHFRRAADIPRGLFLRFGAGNVENADEIKCQRAVGPDIDIGTLAVSRRAIACSDGRDDG
jgi:hypothetical protein